MSGYSSSSREGDRISVTIDEGNRTLFEMRNVVIEGAISLSNLIVQNVLSGVDADDIQVRQTAMRADPLAPHRMARDLVVEFIAAPDTASPADANQDNRYDFSLDGALAAAFAPLIFDVQVLDIV